MTRTSSSSLPSTRPARHEAVVSDYLRILYKRRWIALPVFLVIFSISAVNTVRQTPVFESHAQLLIESDGPKVAKIDQMFDGNSYNDDEFYQTQYRILQSRTLAKATIDAMKLWDAPRLGNGPVPKATISIMGLAMSGVQSVITLIRMPFRSSTPAPVVNPEAALKKSETARQSSRIDQFLGGLSIVPVRSSRIVEVRYRSTDPKFAADAANAVSAAYIQQNLEFRFNSSKDAADWLGDRLAEQRSALQASESALQSYKESNGTVSVTDSSSNIVVQRLTDLNSALTKAKTERINKEALYNQLKGAEGTGTLDTFPTVVANEYIQKLRSELSDLQRDQAAMSQRYGDRNPELIKIRQSVESSDAKLKIELGKVVESVRNDYETALSAERTLQSSLDAQKTEALSLNRKGIEYGVLQREVESNRQIYESLMQRTKETGISSEMRTSNVRVMDPAEIPRGAVSPDIQRELMVGFAGSLVLAIGLAFGLEFLDNRIRTPEQVRSELGLPFLGMIPTLSAKDRNDDTPLLHRTVAPNFAEAMRSIRTSLLFSSAEEGSKMLVITSTAPGEGKTTVACNLAVALAQAEQRVILIDADMRRPRIHHLFDIPQEPGLSNIIVGNVSKITAIRRSEVEGLSLLPAGHNPPNPSELVSSRRFRELIATLKDEYDWILIDSPPVIAVTEASLLAHDATGVLFVVGCEMVDRKGVTVALDQLEAASARFVGAVLNRVNLDGHQYYYSHYYRKNYARHYAAPAKS
jgi:capsular exopolysaccharide synthesis family protein